MLQRRVPAIQRRSPRGARGAARRSRRNDDEGACEGRPPVAVPDAVSVLRQVLALKPYQLKGPELVDRPGGEGPQQHSLGPGLAWQDERRRVAVGIKTELSLSSILNINVCV